MMRKLLLMAVLVMGAIGFSFIGVQAENLQDQVYALYGRFDAGILTLMYPVGSYDFETQEFSMVSQFDVNELVFGLNLKLPLGLVYLRGAAYTTVGDVMNFSENGTLGIYARLGAGLNILLLTAEAGVRLFYLYGDPEFQFNFSPQSFYIALGLSF